MDWFLYDNGLRHEKVKNQRQYKVIISVYLAFNVFKDIIID